MLLNKVAGTLQVGLDQRGLHLAAQHTGNRSHEKGHRLGGNHREHQRHHQPVHQRAFGIVHPEAALAVFWRTQGGLQASQLGAGQMAVGLHQVFDDGCRLGHHFAVIADHRRLAQRVHGFELCRGQTGQRIARVDFQLIRHAQLFEQPENALRARRLQVMDDKHDDILGDFAMHRHGQRTASIRTVARRSKSIRHGAHSRPLAGLGHPTHSENRTPPRPLFDIPNNSTSDRL